MYLLGLFPEIFYIQFQFHFTCALSVSFEWVRLPNQRLWPVYCQIITTQEIYPQAPSPYDLGTHIKILIYYNINLEHTP